MQGLLGVILFLFASICYSHGKVNQGVETILYLKSPNLSQSSPVQLQLTPAVHTQLEKLGFMKHRIMDSTTNGNGPSIRKKSCKYIKRVTVRDILDISLETLTLETRLPELMIDEEVKYVRQFLEGERNTTCTFDVSRVSAVELEFAQQV